MLTKIPSDDTHDNVDVTEGENNQAAGDNSQSMKEDIFGKDELSDNGNLTGIDNPAFEPPGIIAKVTEL